jgi:hypothetical protein
MIKFSITHEWQNFITHRVPKFYFRKINFRAVTFYTAAKKFPWKCFQRQKCRPGARFREDRQNRLRRRKVAILARTSPKGRKARYALNERFMRLTAFCPFRRGPRIPVPGDLPGGPPGDPPTLIKGWLICDPQLCPVRGWGCHQIFFWRNGRGYFRLISQKMAQPRQPRDIISQNRKSRKKYALNEHFMRLTSDFFSRKLILGRKNLPGAIFVARITKQCRPFGCFVRDLKSFLPVENFFSRKLFTEYFRRAKKNILKIFLTLKIFCLEKFFTRAWNFFYKKNLAVMDYKIIILPWYWKKFNFKNVFSAWKIFYKFYRIFKNLPGDKNFLARYFLRSRDPKNYSVTRRKLKFQIFIVTSRDDDRKFRLALF